MQVLLYTHDWAPTIGGIQTITAILANALAQRGYAVTLVTNTPAKGMDDAKMLFRIVRQPRLVELFRLLREADVIHLAGPCFLPLLFGVILRKRVVVEHHLYQAICPNGVLIYQPTKEVCPGHFLARRYLNCLRCNSTTVGWPKSSLMLLLSFPRRLLCQLVDANSAITNHVQRRLRLPRTRVTYYGIPVPSPVIQGQVVDPATAPPICFAYVGRLSSEKGLLVLVEAASRLKAKGLPFRLKFVGDGPERSAIEQAVASAGLTDRVVFTGPCLGEALARETRDVAAVVMPSIWEETAGLSAIEHMMKERLVIASDIAGLAEVVGDAALKFKRGDPVDLAECMKHVIDDPGIIRRLGLAAGNRATKLFREELMVADFCNLYSQLLSANRRPAA